MKLIVLSDTHGMHRGVKFIPDGDVLIHCGDISNVGERHQVEGFIDWIESQPHKHKIFIAGNHDRSFDPKFNKEPNPYWDVETASKFNTTKPYWLQDLLKSLSGTNVHYLEDSGITIEGIKFWGSPWTPWFHGTYWGFNKWRGPEIREVWNQIPNDTDVLITHGPQMATLDWTMSGECVGCEDLEYRIKEINLHNKLRYHFFGHVHESGGVVEKGNTIFANACVLNQNYNITREPLEFEI